MTLPMTSSLMNDDAMAARPLLLMNRMRQWESRMKKPSVMLSSAWRSSSSTVLIVAWMTSGRGSVFFAMYRGGASARDVPCFRAL
jgi:hypothetical protein